MALQLTDIRKGVADNARTAAGVDDSKHYRADVTHSGTTFQVDLESVEPSAMGRNRWTVRLAGWLTVAGAWDRSKQEKVDGLLPLVWTAIESDPTANGFAQTLHVVDSTVIRDLDGDPVAVRYDIEVEA